MAMLGRNHYGKSAVRLVKIARQGDRHELRDLTVAVALEGDFVDAHISGDNTRVLPTDTMKNTVYALAKQHLTGAIENFALVLTDHFLSTAPISAARVAIREHSWRRLAVHGREHEHAFAKAGSEVRTARVRRTSAGVSVRSGVRGLTVLKTTGSGFVGYIKDRFTTLPETTDRILATIINAEWTANEIGELAVDFDREWAQVVEAVTDTFAQHDSLSVQHTLFAMGEAVLARCARIERIRFELPNKHHLLVDLEKFGIENENEIFVATREPYGLIVAELGR